MKKVRFGQHQDWELQHHLQIPKDRYPQYQQGHNVHQKWSLHLWPSHIDSVKSGLVGYMKKFRLWQIPHIQIYHHDLHLEWDLQHHLQILKDLHPQYQGQSLSERGSPLFTKPCTQYQKRASGSQSGTGPGPEPVVDIEEDSRFPVSDELRKLNLDGKYPDEKVLRHFIRDAAASLQAVAGKSITQSDFVDAAIKICQEVPILKDPRPACFPPDMKYPYWVIVHVTLSMYLPLMFKVKPTVLTVSNCLSHYSVLQRVQRPAKMHYQRSSHFVSKKQIMASTHSKLTLLDPRFNIFRMKPS